MMTETEVPIKLRGALILAEEERMGILVQRLRAEVTELLIGESITEVQLQAGLDTEDYRARDRLLLLFPADPVNGLEGFFILGLTASGTEPATVRRVCFTENRGRTSVQLEVRSGIEMEGQWAYSRRPKMRKVVLASFDDPLETFEGAIFHAADFQQGAVKPRQLPGEAGWSIRDFELPAMLLEESSLLDCCERLLEALSARSRSYLEWSEDELTERELDQAAGRLERSILRQGQHFDLTLEVAGHEIVRGKRLQPLVSYPITLMRRDGGRIAATLGCSISGR